MQTHQSTSMGEEAIKEAIKIFARILGGNHKEILTGLFSFLNNLEEKRYMGIVFELEVPTALNTLFG